MCSSDLIAKLKYTYGGRVVGSVNVVPSKAEVEDNFFGEKNNPSDKNVIVIKTSHILIALGILIGLVVAIFVGKRLYDNYYVIRHDMEVKKQRRQRFRTISKRKKKWRRRDRMFR